MYVKWGDYVDRLAALPRSRGQRPRLYFHCLKCNKELMRDTEVWCIRTMSRLGIRMTGECRECREKRPRKVRARTYRETELDWRQKHPSLKIHCKECGKEFDDEHVRRYVENYRPHNICCRCVTSRSLLSSAQYMTRGELLAKWEAVPDKRWLRPLPDQCKRCRTSYHVAKYVVCPWVTRLGYRVLNYCSACCKL